MPGWAKALIIVGILLVVFVVAIIGGGMYWWSQNKATVTGGLAEGKAAGKLTDNQGCVNQSVDRYKADRGFTAVIGNSIFMSTCLQASRPTPGFCDDVPRQMEFTATAKWRLAQCDHFDLSGDKYCQQLFTPVQQFCERHGGTGSSEQTNGN